MNLALLAELNDVEKQLNDVQALLDEARSRFPDDQAFQYECDLQQTEIDYKRRLVTNAKMYILSPN